MVATEISIRNLNLLTIIGITRQTRQEITTMVKRRKQLISLQMQKIDISKIMIIGRVLEWQLLVASTKKTNTMRL